MSDSRSTPSSSSTTTTATAATTTTTTVSSNVTHESPENVQAREVRTFVVASFFL